MARLRVPASPAKARPAVSAYASVINQTNNRPSYDPRSAGPIYLHHGEHASEMSPPPKPSIQSPIKGAVKSLTSMSRATKRDVQGYIVGQYKAVEKVGHEHVDRTGTKTVFFLGGEREEEEEEVEHLDEVMKAALGAYVNEEEDEDRPWNGMRDFMRKDATLKTGASAKTKAPSLAQCIASAGVDDADSDLDSDPEDDEVDLSQKIEHAISSFAEKTEEYEDDQEDTTTTPPTNNYVRRSPLLSPLGAIDIPHPRKPKQNFGLRWHSGSRSLAYLIAHAEDFSSSPDEDDRWPSRSSSASPSPSPSPSQSPNVGDGGDSADDALDVLRERFRIVHCVGGGTGCYRREWLDAKFEMGCSMVHGPSLLRFATNCYEDEDENMLRVRPSPSKDTLNARSSIRTSLFSKCTSATSMSSYRTIHPQSAQTEHSRLMDALDLVIDEHKREDGYNFCATTSRFDGTVQDEKRISSLPILTIQGWSGELWISEADNLPNTPECMDDGVDEVARPCVPAPASIDNPGERSPVVRVNETSDLPLVREETDEFYDNVSNDSNSDSESASAPFDFHKCPHRKWTSRMKYCLQKMPKKTKQATRGCVKATKEFSRTVWSFVPAALSSRHPFQKIDNII